MIYYLCQSTVVLLRLFDVDCVVRQIVVDSDFANAVVFDWALDDVLNKVSVKSEHLCRAPRVDRRCAQVRTLYLSIHLDPFRQLDLSVFKARVCRVLCGSCRNCFDWLVGVFDRPFDSKAVVVMQRLAASESLLRWNNLDSASVS